jgi:hypothetical protein
MGWKAGVRYPVREIYFLPHNIQAGYGIHPISSPIGTGLFPRVKRKELEADQSPPCSAEVKNGILPFPHASLLSLIIFPFYTLYHLQLRQRR